MIGHLGVALLRDFYCFITMGNGSFSDNPNKDHKLVFF